MWGTSVSFSLGDCPIAPWFLACLCWGGGGGGSVAIVQWGLYIILRVLVLGRGLYIVHKTDRRPWSAVA